MADEEVAIVDTPPVPSPDTEYYGGDGSFKDGWLSSLPEDLRVEPSLKTYKNVESMARSLVNATKMVGLDKNRLVVAPNDKSEKTIWDAFYKAGGRPETPDEYKLDIPEEMKDYYDDGQVKDARTLFHTLGFNQKQVDALWAFDRSRLEKGITAMSESDKVAREEAENTLKEKWGNAYQNRLNLANRMISENSDDNSRPELLEIIGNNPQVADFLANIAGKFIEHKIIKDVEFGESPADIDTKIKEEMANPAYLDASNPMHKLQVQKVYQLHERKAKMAVKQ